MDNHITVRCDAPGCDWEIQEKADEAKRWHNAQCPKCSHAPVLSDADMDVLTCTLALRDMGIAYIGESVPDDGKAYVDIRLNTRPLRGKQ
jgi:hypothetical protein